jgi:ATP/maltotriose-dependent transcriptional regulator MalT
MFSPPTQDAFSVERKAAVAEMESVPRRCIVYIHAPAGFGKTAACAQWLSGRKTAWFTLDGYTADAARFCGGVLDALSAGVPAGAVTSDVFAEALRGVTVWPSALVIDDFHLCTDTRAQKALLLLRARMPGETSLAVISRAAPPEALRAQLVKGALRPVTGLAFSSEEISALARKMGSPVTQYFSGFLFKQTGGCAAALAQILHSGDGGYCGVPGRESLNAYMRGLVFDAEYFGALKKCAVCDTLNPSLCAAITGTHGIWAHICTLAGKTGLIAGLPGGEWRFHTLLRDYLEYELLRDGTIDKPALFKAAAAWHMENGDLLRALDMAAKSGDLAFADGLSDIPQNKKAPVSAARYAALIEASFLSIPMGVTRDYPRLANHCFAAALLARPLREALRWADIMEGHMSGGTLRGEDKTRAAFFLSADTRHSSWHVPGQIGRLAASPLAANLPTLTCNLPFFHKAQRDFSDIAPKLREYTAALKQRIGEEPPPPLGALVSLIEAGVRFERGELAEAENAARDLCALSEHLCPEIFFCVHALYSEIRRVQGKKAEPERIGEMIARKDALFLRDNYAAFLTETRLYVADRASAELWLGRAGPEGPVRLHNLYVYFVKARALLVLNRLYEAETLFEELAAFAREYRRNADFISAHCLLAVCRWRMKRPSEAVEAAVPALLKAAELGLVMPVAREGGGMLPVLRKVINRLKYGYDPQRLDRAFLGVLYRHTASVACGVPGLFAGHTERPVSLSPRQSEVLGCLENNLSYREIARRLGISPATVDDHIRRLHEKLNATSTREALNRARELGIRTGVRKI